MFPSLVAWETYVVETTFCCLETRKYFSSGQKHFCSPDTNFASETYVSQAQFSQQESDVKKFQCCSLKMRAYNTGWRRRRSRRATSRSKKERNQKKGKKEAGYCEIDAQTSEKSGIKRNDCKSNEKFWDHNLWGNKPCKEKRSLFRLLRKLVYYYTHAWPFVFRCNVSSFSHRAAKTFCLLPLI